MGSPKSSSPQTRTGLSCHDAILKKTDRIADSIGWSRNALIVASMVHIIRMIEDKSYNAIPDVVLQARAVIHGDKDTLKFPESDLEKILKDHRKEK
ncbi:MAG: hypothetical protein FJ390_06915 [Verrucomicrobia bacterium]|nr:hypothetical protein [Verrucomicrobiota bacterium]